MKKLAENCAYYYQICQICSNMPQYAFKWRAIYRHINLFFFDLQYTGILHRYPQSVRYVTIRDRYHRRYAYRPSYIWGGISRRHRYALSMWYICGNILLRIFRHISVYITYTVAYFDILFEFRMFSEYHFSDMEIYHITNFTRITRILLSILLILLISSFRGKSSTRLGGNRSVIRFRHTRSDLIPIFNLEMQSESRPKLR